MNSPTSAQNKEAYLKLVDLLSQDLGIGQQAERIKLAYEIYDAIRAAIHTGGAYCSGFPLDLKLGIQHIGGVFSSRGLKNLDICVCRSGGHIYFQVCFGGIYVNWNLPKERVLDFVFGDDTGGVTPTAIHQPRAVGELHWCYGKCH